MKAASYSGLFIAVLAFLGSALAADQAKTLDVSDYPLFSHGKAVYRSQFVPGLIAALELTDAQKQQLIAAKDELENSEAMQFLRGSRNDPSVRKAQLIVAEAALDDAHARRWAKVGEILTPEQKALIKTVNGAYSDTIEEIQNVYEPKFASSEGNAARERLREEKKRDIEELFKQKLAGILSASQKEAMDRAAAEELLQAPGKTVK